ncbi:hypothetical protein BDC45DRAFT_552978 [Circinella umbellata]|nr:hypothetical protein BDC45DRAFT_552978 [Circinella umbellata]
MWLELLRAIQMDLLAIPAMTISSTWRCRRVVRCNEKDAARFDKKMEKLSSIPGTLKGCSLSCREQFRWTYWLSLPRQFPPPGGGSKSFLFAVSLVLGSRRVDIAFFGHWPLVKNITTASSFRHLIFDNRCSKHLGIRSNSLARYTPNDPDKDQMDSFEDDPWFWPGRYAEHISA